MREDKILAQVMMQRGHLVIADDRDVSVGHIFRAGQLNRKRYAHPVKVIGRTTFEDFAEQHRLIAQIVGKPGVPARKCKKFYYLVDSD